MEKQRIITSSSLLQLTYHPPHKLSVNLETVSTEEEKSGTDNVLLEWEGLGDVESPRNEMAQFHLTPTTEFVKGSKATRMRNAQ